MSFICMCASEDCAVNGCQRLRGIAQRQVPSLPPAPVVAPAAGWVCPRCGTVNAPFMPACVGCRPDAKPAGTTP